MTRTRPGQPPLPRGTLHPETLQHRANERALRVTSLRPEHFAERFDHAPLSDEQRTLIGALHGLDEPVVSPSQLARRLGLSEGQVLRRERVALHLLRTAVLPDPRAASDRSVLTTASPRP